MNYPRSKLRGINSLHSHANAVQGKDMRSKRVMDEMIFSDAFMPPPAMMKCFGKNNLSVSHREPYFQFPYEDLLPRFKLQVQL